MRYFKDRQEAGKQLSNKLSKHSVENCVIISLSEGGVVVGAEIAKDLHTGLFLLITEGKELPEEINYVASANSLGLYSYNPGAYSTGELELLSAEGIPSIEQERMNAFQKINRFTKKEDTIPKKLLKNHVVILVSDGFSNGISLSVACDFLKTVATKKIIVCTPIASERSVDRMHLMADEIICLSVVEDFINTDHYYQDNKMPSHEDIIEKTKNIIFEWTT